MPVWPRIAHSVLSAFKAGKRIADVQAQGAVGERGAGDAPS
jgi:hypothetical protein